MVRKNFVNDNDCCPYCKQESQTMSGLSYPCGSYFTFSGFNQSASCVQASLINSRLEKLEDIAE